MSLKNMARFRVIATLLGKCARDQNGVTMVVTALGATAIIGFTGLAIDVASWEVTLRKMQGAADQAALAALTVANASGSTATCPSTACTEAEAVAANYGFVNGQSNATVTVNQPPKQGSYTASSSALEVIISQPQSLMFTGLFLSTPPTVKARAVVNSAAGSMCVMALDTSGKTAIGSVDLTGTTTVNLPNCDLYNDSPVAASTELKGSAVLGARNIFLSGGISESNNASISASGSLKTYATAMPNPYANLTIPTYSGCNQTGKYEVKSNTPALTNPSPSVPYVFCGDVIVDAGATLTLPAGTYIINGNLTVNGNGTLNGTGVTIILTGTGSTTFNGGSTENLTAPTAGATVGIPGIAIWDANSTMTSQGDTFNGGTTENITGAIYAPHEQLNYAGGSSTTSGCTQLVALTVTFTGNANFGNSCTNSGVSEPLLPPALVE
jgi:Flp pilus assembly protein TadG